MDKIVVKGAREHNLKNIDVEIPKNKLVVITGISGSGKSSLAFDTLYAEGQRRYIESLSAYARQFLGKIKKPDVDYIEGLSPSISIDQRGVSHNPRSTVGTVTEIYDYMRLLFARIGVPHCPKCGRKIERQTVDQMVDRIKRYPDGSKIQILAPVVKGKKGEFKNLFAKIRREGFVRVRVDGVTMWVEEEIPLDRNKRHNIEVVVDRVVLKEDVLVRLADSLEVALKLAEGTVLVLVDEEELMFSERFACPVCGISLPKIEPRLFSFNSPYGACPVCDGIGFKMEFDPELMIDEDLSISKGAILPWRGRRTERFYMQRLASVARHYGFSLDTPFKELPKDVKKILLYGSHNGEIEFVYDTKHGFWEHTGGFEGIIPYLMRRYEEAESDEYRESLHSYMRLTPCPACGGKRLRPEALAVTIMGKSIADFSDMSIDKLRDFMEDLSVSEKEYMVVGEVLKEIKQRLSFLAEIGVGYLTLSRLAATLSGGESQRIRLATQIGSKLSGVLYVLDEPTVGLHPRDTDKLIGILKELRSMGNTVVVVEHDENTIRHADYLIEMGPGAGEHGGEVVATGEVNDILKVDRSPTALYLSGKLKIDVPHQRRKGIHFLKIRGASQFNLKNIDVDIPLETFVCLTGVSGSGKSTLLYEIIYKGIKHKLRQSREKPGKFKDILGWEQIKRVVVIDQSPIGRTPRSNPATYTGAFTPIRELFASLPESKVRGYKVGRFSFNVPGGRCSACKGEGMIRVQMQFLPDVYIPCDVCGGKRYNAATLEVKYKGKSIADVLDMSVEEALEFFHNYPSIRRKLQLLADVGLDYIKLGQSATTLSGGEAQRVKLATELSKTSTKGTLYLLDEPTTGLHMSEVNKLISVLQRLVEMGNTVIVIEHNLDVIKVADFVIDLGPEGGEEGGYVVATGTPEEVASTRSSYTGRYLSTKLYHFQRGEADS